MYFVLEILKIFINIIQLYMFRRPLRPSSGASQLHMQSLFPINYKNPCCLQIYHYVHFIITTNYLCGTYKTFLIFMFVLCCFFLVCGSVGFVSCIMLWLHTVWCLHHTVCNHNIIHLVVCLTTVPKHLPKPALHIVRSRASSFK